MAKNWRLMLERKDAIAIEALAELQRVVDDLDRCYAEAFNGEPVTADDLAEAEDPADYIGMGWVDRNGRP